MVGKIQVRSWHYTSSFPTFHISSMSSFQGSFMPPPGLQNQQPKLTAALIPEYLDHQRSPSVTWAHHSSLHPFLSCRGLVLGVKADNSRRWIYFRELPTLRRVCQRCHCFDVQWWVYCSHFPLWLLQTQLSAQSSSPLSCPCFTLLSLFPLNIRVSASSLLELHSGKALSITLCWIFNLCSSASLLVIKKKKCTGLSLYRNVSTCSLTSLTWKPLFLAASSPTIPGTVWFAIT